MSHKILIAIILTLAALALLLSNSGLKTTKNTSKIKRLSETKPSDHRAVKAFIQKATIRVKEQAKFIEMFRTRKEFVEAWGLFSYGGFTDSGQSQILKTNDNIFLYYAEPTLLSQNKSSQDGHLKYKKYTISHKNPSGKKFQSKVQDLNLIIKPFYFKHFDGYRFEYVYLRKDEMKIYTKRIYFDDPYLKPKETVNIQNLLSLFNNFINTSKK